MVLAALRAAILACMASASALSAAACFAMDFLAARRADISACIAPSSLACSAAVAASVARGPLGFAALVHC